MKGYGLPRCDIRCPYGNLERQAVQRFAALEDLDAASCTIEEREEYEPHLAQGGTVYAGVDYERILREVEDQVDVIVWDGGNNDWSFFVPDLELVLVDPHRAGEPPYFPGEVNLIRADVVVFDQAGYCDARTGGRGASIH
jgi:predicted GTPase